MPSGIEAGKAASWEPEGPWPPAVFNSITAERDDIGRNREELLAEGFGRGS